jgi:cytochrome c1
MLGVGARAATRKPGYSAELYLYESITQPSASITQGFQDGLMPPNFKDVLTPQQMSDLVAYLASLK